MPITKKMLLQGMADSGTSLTEYIITEMGLDGELEELVRDGLVVRVHRTNDFDEIRITDKGRAFARTENSGHPPL